MGKSRKKMKTKIIIDGRNFFKNKRFKTSDTLENTEIVMNQSFWIGVFPGLTTDMLEYIVKQFKAFVLENK